MTNSQTLRNYAQFNQFQVDCRISNSEIVERKNGDRFLAVTAITNCLNDDDGMTITFNDSNGLMALFEKGWLPKGRQITLVGHVASIRETYTDAKSGEVRLLKRPTMHLVDAGIPTGGLGPMPNADRPATRRQGTTVVRPSDANKQADSAAPFVDKTPTLQEQAF